LARVAPLRICIDARIPGGTFGGVEQVLIGIASGLSKLTDGDEEFLFLAHPEHDGWLRPYLAGPCRLLPARRGRINRTARAVVRAAAERLPGIGMRFALRQSDGTIERAGVDLVHFPVQDAFLTEVPSIYQPHDLQHVHLRELFSRWEHDRREVVYRTHCERARMVVAMSSWGRRDLIQTYGLPGDKVQIVPWGSVLFEYPTPSERDLADLRATLGLADGFLLYPAQTWPHKNHERLLEALALIRDRDNVSIPLVCPGTRKSQFGQIRDRIDSLGLGDTVRFPGFVSSLELRGLYELATALAFPSLFEGWGLPICEAFSAGLPIASSTATCLPDLVADAGLLFDPNDVEEMSVAIRRVWSDERLRQSLAERGRERSKLFDFDRTALLFRAHYRRVAERRLSEQDRILLASPPLA
jgi:glycosyltransferase involved in cell wall biosynthesis